MKHQKVNIKLMQKITYSHGDNELIEQLFEGEYFELTGYQKLRYYRSPDELVELKWYNSSDCMILEIKQSNGKLYFHPLEETCNLYRTPQGIWDLKIKTNHLLIEQIMDQTHIKVNYQMFLNEENLADYDFQLIFNE